MKNTLKTISILVIGLMITLSTGCNKDKINNTKPKPFQPLYTIVTTGQFITVGKSIKVNNIELYTSIDSSNYGLVKYLTTQKGDTLTIDGIIKFRDYQTTHIVDTMVLIVDKFGVGTDSVLVTNSDTIKTFHYTNIN